MPNYGNAKFLYYQLNALRERQCVASVFCTLDAPEVFSAGYLDCVTRQQFLMCAITPYGEADGYLARRIQDVYQVLFDEEYEERLDVLVKINNGRLPPLIAEDEPRNLFFVLLCIAREHALPVSIWTDESTFSGMVVSVDELRAVIKSWDYFGRDEGEIAINLRGIQLVSADSQEERMYKLLGKHPNLTEGLKW